MIKYKVRRRTWFERLFTFPWLPFCTEIFDIDIEASDNNPRAFKFVHPDPDSPDDPDRFVLRYYPVKKD